MIISTNAEKTYGKIQHLFIITVLKKAGIMETYSNIIKSVYDKPTANIIFRGKMKAFPLGEEKDKDTHSHHFYSM